jgi:hypothetical protein
LTELGIPEAVTRRDTRIGGFGLFQFQRISDEIALAWISTERNSTNIVLAKGFI